MHLLHDYLKCTIYFYTMYLQVFNGIKYLMDFMDDLFYPFYKSFTF